MYDISVKIEGNTWINKNKIFLLGESRCKTHSLWEDDQNDLRFRMLNIFLALRKCFKLIFIFP